MYDHETGEFFDGNIPQGESLVDGHSTREVPLEYEQDFIEIIKEHEPDLEQ